MNELPILIARLGWPSTSARWWTMQELAARLGNQSSRIETESALLQLLSSRKLEAEVVEVLCVFWMAAQMHDYSPSPNLALSIPRPSILSDLLLGSLGMSAEPGDEGLEEVSETFEIPQDFEGVHGSDLPPIFRVSMRELEEESGLPFDRQMAFEWAENRAAYPDATFQGDPWHFSRALGNDFIGQVSSRTALRVISGYLRTLAVAKQFWEMPKERAEIEALQALPIHPTFAFLKPCRPAWLPKTTDFDGDTEAIESSLRALIGRVQDARPGDELITFTSPVMMSMERCVEVSLVRWSQTAGSSIADTDLTEHLKSFLTEPPMIQATSPKPLSISTLLFPPPLVKILDNECMAWPLAAPIDFDRRAYLQPDLYPFRLFLPTLPGSGRAQVIPRDGLLTIEVNQQIVADLRYWNAGWSIARPMQLGGNCGTALISQGTIYREGFVSTSETMRSFYLWQIRSLNRVDSYDRRFSETLSRGVLFV